jgi:hypothetical protein
VTRARIPDPTHAAHSRRRTATVATHYQQPTPVAAWRRSGNRPVLAAGQSTAVELGVAPVDVGPTTVTWQASAGSGGLQLNPSSGTLILRSGDASGNAAGCTRTSKPANQSLTLTSGAPGSYRIHVDLRTSTRVRLPPVVLDVAVQP